MWCNVIRSLLITIELTIKEKWENQRIIPFETPQEATFCFKKLRIDYDHLINLCCFGFRNYFQAWGSRPHRESVYFYLFRPLKISESEPHNIPGSSLLVSHPSIPSFPVTWKQRCPRIYMYSNETIWDWKINIWLKKINTRKSFWPSRRTWGLRGDAKFQDLRKGDIQFSLITRYLQNYTLMRK